MRVSFARSRERPIGGASSKACARQGCPTRERVDESQTPEGETVSRLGLFVALALCFVAGYLLAGLWSRGASLSGSSSSAVRHCEIALRKATEGGRSKTSGGGARATNH